MKTLAMILSGLAFLITAAATLYVLNLPVYKGIETVHTESGTTTIETTKTVAEANGPWVVYLLIGLTLISGVPLFIAFTRPTLLRLVMWVSMLLLMAFSILGAFTIGLAFMPGAILLLAGAILTLFIRKDTAR